MLIFIHYGRAAATFKHSCHVILLMLRLLMLHQQHNQCINFRYVCDILQAPQACSVLSVHNVRKEESKTKRGSLMSANWREISGFKIKGSLCDLWDVKFGSGIKHINFGLTLTPMCVSTVYLVLSWVLWTKNRMHDSGLIRTHNLL